MSYLLNVCCTFPAHHFKTPEIVSALLPLPPWFCPQSKTASDVEVACDINFEMPEIAAALLPLPPSFCSQSDAASDVVACDITFQTPEVVAALLPLPPSF
eukprot:366449-Chlamydomonas_euryale.AAC.22